MVLGFHLALSVVLFIIINKIGSISYTSGYMSLSLVYQADESPAFNFVFKTLTPTVFIILVTTVLKSYDLSELTVGVWLVSLYQALLRLLVNFFYRRWSLLNWRLLTVQNALTVGLSYWVYSYILVGQNSLLPNPAALLDQMWIIIVLYLYSVLNKVTFNPESSRIRKSKAISSRLRNFQNRYEYIVSSLKHPGFESLVYAIMLIEDFNRPKPIRFVEYFQWIVTRQRMTLGIMQVSTESFLTDADSVVVAINRLIKVYEGEKARIAEIDDLYEKRVALNSILGVLIKSHNGGSDYLKDVEIMWQVVMEELYPSKYQRGFE